MPSASGHRSRVIITGDVLRCEVPGQFYNQLGNARWLHGLLEAPLAEATGSQPELVFTSFTDEEDMAAIYKSLGLPQNAEGWIQLFDTVPDDVTQRLFGDMERALIVGFELPPGLVESFERLGARTLNVGIHPIRFMDDIFFGFETADPQLAQGLARHALPERLAYRAAGVVKAYMAREPLTRFPAPAAVFAGQMPIDRSLIRDGRLVTAEDLSERIEETFGRFETVLLKPHPLARENPVIDKIKALGLRTESTDLDFYQLASHPDVGAVIAISSGTCQEAPYFGKAGIHLSHCATPCLWQGDAPTDKGWWGVYDSFLAPDFWRDILAPVMEVTPKDGDVPQPKPNRLRIALRQFWGFGVVDPKALVMHSGVAPNLDRMRSELAFIDSLRRRADRIARIPILGGLFRWVVNRLR